MDKEFMNVLHENIKDHQVADWVRYPTFRLAKVRVNPLAVACEGRFAAFVAEADAPRALARLRARDGTAAAIGRVTAERSPEVFIKSVIGARRILDMPSGEQLPRIC